MAEAQLKVSVIGSGPAGFYAADALLRAGASVDLFERLPVPFGLVRYGVAPDHQSIKRVQAAFEKTAQHPGFRFYGNVEVGRDVTSDELAAGYHAVVVACGSALDRRLGIPGEDLRGSYAATAFVGWYNAHPDFVDQHFELDSERAVVVGMGNVALDVARILLRDPKELASSDVSDTALRALEQSRVREVVLLGRRGPAQAAFDQGELEAIVDLPGISVVVDGEVSLLDEAELPAAARKNLAYLAQLKLRPPADTPRRLRLRFLASPLELLGGERVRALRIEENQLVGRGLEAKTLATGRTSELETGVVIRSVGYHGKALPGLPFDAKKGVIPNVAGRVLSADGTPLPGWYVTGWIKRGPSGLIGTNKACAKETVDQLLMDRAALETRPLARDIPALLAERGVKAVSFAEYRNIDAVEKRRGEERGKPRDKLERVADMLAVAFARA